MIRFGFIAVLIFSILSSDANAQNQFAKLKKVFLGFVHADKSKKTAHSAAATPLTIIDGPYKTKQVIICDILPTSPITHLFDIEKHQITKYVALNRKEKNEPKILEELNKYDPFKKMNEESAAKKEPLFQGRIFSGHLNCTNEPVLIHETWLQSSLEK